MTIISSFSLKNNQFSVKKLMIFGFCGGAIVFAHVLTIFFRSFEQFKKYK
jgi:hypothetical protein